MRSRRLRSGIAAGLAFAATLWAGWLVYRLVCYLAGG